MEVLVFKTLTTFFCEDRITVPATNYQKWLSRLLKQATTYHIRRSVLRYTQRSNKHDKTARQYKFRSDKTILQSVNGTLGVHLIDWRIHLN